MENSSPSRGKPPGMQNTNTSLSSGNNNIINNSTTAGASSGPHHSSSNTTLRASPSGKLTTKSKKLAPLEGNIHDFYHLSSKIVLF